MVSQDLTRIENLERGLTVKQTEKLQAVRHQMELAIARQYGARLHQIMVDKLVREMIVRPEVLAHLEGVTVTELPTDLVGWTRLACDAVGDCELSQRSLAASDDALKTGLTNEVLRRIPRAEKMSMARAGTLDNYVAAELEIRMEVELNRSSPIGT